MQRHSRWKRNKQIPLSDVDSTYTRITNGIRDAIAPDVTIFVKYILEKEGVIRVENGGHINQNILENKRADYGKQIVVMLSRQLSWSHFFALIPLKSNGAKIQTILAETRERMA